MGINENSLYYNKKPDVINNNPQIRSQSKNFKDAYYSNKENNRNNLIDSSRSQRNNLLLKQKKMINYPHFSPNQYMSQVYYNKNLKNSKSLTDFWSLRYNKEKEDELVYFLKRQNLSEIKNLIDETLKLRKKAKFHNHQKYKQKEEEKIVLKKNYLIKRDKIIKAQENLEKEIDLLDRKKKEKEFNKECLYHRQIEEMKEKIRIEKQNEIRKKQIEWESKNYEHMTKVESMYQKKHELAVQEYLGILKKGLQRYEKIDERKNEFNTKCEIEKNRRSLYLVNFKNKNNEIEKNIRNKFEKKHKDISKFYLMQKEIKRNIIHNQKLNREEKIKSNIYKKLINKSMEKERKKKLLDLFEKNEEKVERKMILRQKQNEEYKYNNLLKSDEITGNYLRNMNIIQNKNRIKMQKMREKNDKINNKIIKRQNSAKNRIDRYDSIRLNKELMMKQVKEILEEIKEYKPEDIYKKVFTDEEINILKN